MFGYFPVPYLDDVYRFYSANHPLRFFYVERKPNHLISPLAHPAKAVVASSLAFHLSLAPLACPAHLWGGQQAGFGYGSGRREQVLHSVTRFRDSYQKREG